ncbi:hypothetical protein [Sedimenticola hydrogenitrophicus]|uniref:hypothetical protein n=1 Tax=Sedimenticola hydrogenitrophicus TaxID=2967975 RepID=UPI0023B10775|nr:hypothetical protein [Sedimenticola hydrogenitrophicus]
MFYNGPLATPNPNDTDHGHYWIGGAEGNEGRWSTRDGPVYPEIVWDFFARHPRDASAPPARHILSGRAVNGGWFGLRALATGDDADIGYAWDFWFAVTLYEGLPGQWYALAPAACRE